MIGERCWPEPSPSQPTVNKVKQFCSPSPSYVEDSAGCCKVQTPGCEACGPQDASSLDAKMTRYNLPLKAGHSSYVSGSTEESISSWWEKSSGGNKKLLSKDTKLCWRWWRQWQEIRGFNGEQGLSALHIVLCNPSLPPLHFLSPTVATP